uniref:Uncharacterized protein n=1 Tax=Rhizophora mucronata TaxID=61149 RepID=A0A2P2P5W5_RHIMU
MGSCNFLESLVATSCILVMAMKETVFPPFRMPSQSLGLNIGDKLHLHIPKRTNNSISGGTQCVFSVWFLVKLSS